MDMITTRQMKEYLACNENKLRECNPALSEDCSSSEIVLYSLLNEIWKIDELKEVIAEFSKQKTGGD